MQKADAEKRSAYFVKSFFVAKKPMADAIGFLTLLKQTFASHFCRLFQSHQIQHGGCQVGKSAGF